MSTNHADNHAAVTVGLVLISILASISLILFEGMDAGVLFFAGYLVIAAISSAFKDKRYSSRRALG